MGTTPPRILKNFNAFVNGKGMAGRIEKLTLPEVSVKMEGYRGGGMDAETEIDMGMESLSAKFTFADPDPDLFRLVGLIGGESARIIARGSFVRDIDGERVAVVAELGGTFKKQSMEDWESGKKASGEFEQAVNYYRLTIGGVEVYEIDKINMVRRIGGVDQMAGIRTDIGL